jgi:hypothetical protein
MIKAEKRSRDDNYEEFGMKVKSKGDQLNDQVEDKTNLSKMTAYDAGMSASEYAELLEEEMYA